MGGNEAQFETRLKSIAQHINTNHEVANLCMAFPDRIDALVLNKGEKIGK